MFQGSRKRARSDSFPSAYSFAPNAGTMLASSRGSGQVISRRRTYNNSRRYAGPYRSLTSTVRHTNPTYPRPEIKTYDVQQTGVVFNGSPTPSQMFPTGTVSSLTSIPQSLSGGGRVGLQIAVKSVAYRFEVDLPTLVTAQLMTSGRVILFWDQQPNGVSPGVADLLTFPSFLAFMNSSAVQRFTILRNTQFSLSPNGNQTLFFEGYVKINMLCTFGPGTSTPFWPVSGGLFLLYIADNLITGSNPLISGCWRTRYMDN